MKLLLKIEEVGIFLLCLFLFSRLSFAWWWFPLLLLFPDIGMMGYAINSRTGAITYNLLHHRLTASLAAIVALSIGNPYWKLIAIVLFAHISLDRALGFGLKHADSFDNTHLEAIGKEQNVCDAL